MLEPQFALTSKNVALISHIRTAVFVNSQKCSFNISYQGSSFDEFSKMQLWYVMLELLFTRILKMWL